MPTDKTQLYSMHLERRKRLLAGLKANASNKSLDKNGSSTNLLALSLRFIGIVEFFLGKNVESFRQNLTESAKLRLDLFQRFELGEGVDPSYITMLSYKNLYDGLAAGNFSVSTDLAQVMGRHPDIEKAHDHPFDRAMGLALKEIVLKIKDGPGRDELGKVVARKENRDFAGYEIAFDGIQAANDKKVDEGLTSIIEGHLRQSRRIFKETVDELLCVWGIGVANLAIERGIQVKVDHPLIPGKLLGPQQ